jgi:hypothetical protein
MKNLYAKGAGETKSFLILSKRNQLINLQSEILPQRTKEGKEIRKAREQEIAYIAIDGVGHMEKEGLSTPDGRALVLDRIQGKQAKREKPPSV